MAKRINTGRLTALLVLWIALLIVPAALEVLGTFGHFDINSSIEGPIIGVWIVGYLVQFAVFMLISRVVDPGFPAWFAASSLPWAIDWTTPVSPFFGLLWVAVAIAIAVWIAAHAKRDEALREHGVHATGVVLQVYQPFMNVIVNGAYIKRKLQLRIEGVPGAAAYEATMSGLFMFGDVPSVGDKLPLLVDPQNPQRFESDDSADSNTASDNAASTTDNYETPSADDAGSIADELGKLAALRARGALTDAEFDAAKKKILN